MTPTPESQQAAAVECVDTVCRLLRMAPRRMWDSPDIDRQDANKWKQFYKDADRSVREILARSSRTATPVSESHAALLEKADKFMWQVRDTCARAEKAEAALEAEKRLTGELENALELARAELRAHPAGGAGTTTHDFVPDPKHPQFCKHCGYAPHERLQHNAPTPHAGKSE